MRITSETIKYFNADGIQHIKDCIVEGCTTQLSENGGENGDFDAMCEAGKTMNEVGHKSFVSFIDELNKFDEDDGFGPRGWEHCFGVGY